MRVNRILAAYKHIICHGVGLFALCVSPAVVMALSACSNGNKGDEQVVAPWGVVNDTVASNATFDLDEIVGNGEMIMATLSGPESYYDYHGKHLGLHFLLCQRFADKIGVSLRVEVCRDTMELMRKLIDGDADVAAYWVSPSDTAALADSSGAVVMCGPRNNSDGASWVAKASSDMLVKAIDEWFKPSMLADVEREEDFLLSSKSVSRRVYAPMQDRQKGIISRYDALFVKHSQHIRWDWRLLAAQCYQESTFDPNAKSWAGACGLMQIMPSTAAHLGLALSDIFTPEANIEAATRYLGELESKFSDIANRNERTNFVLASYNGGYHHIRDAMSLAAKNGSDPKSWSEVSRYVLLLSEPRYYRDPVVKHGYMRGFETVGYVSKIRQRWQQYGGVRSPHGSASGLTPRKARHSKKKFKLNPDGQ